MVDYMVDRALLNVCSRLKGGRVLFLVVGRLYGG